MLQNTKNNEFLESVENLRKLFDIQPSEAPIEFTNNLEDHKDKITQMLMDDEGYNLIAPMSSGKTTTLLKIAVENNIKVLMIVPLVSLAVQKKEDFSEKYSITLGAVHGEDPINGIEEISDEQIRQFILKKQIIISVYDSLPRVVRVISQCMSEEHLKEYVLLIDESHNLVTQSDFRIKAVYNVDLLQAKFKKTIFISGTPECTILNKFKKVQFVKKDNAIKTKIHIIKYSSQGMHKVFCHLLSRKINGKVVIVYDNVNELEILKELIVKYLKVQEKDIKIISRNDKQDDTYIKIVKEETINVPFLLTTRIISDGINIFDTDVQHLYFMDMKDYWLKRQFISRFRKGVENIYDFTKKSYFIPLTIKDYREEFKKIRDKREAKRKILQDYIDNGMEVSHKITHIKLSAPIKKERDRVIYLDDRENKYKIIFQKIALILIDEVNRSLNSSANLSAWFYAEICKYDIITRCDYKDLVDIGDVKESITEKEFMNEAVKYEMDIDYSDYSSLVRYLPTMLSITMRRLNKKIFFDNFNTSELLISSCEEKELDEFYIRHINVFNKMKKTLNYMIDLLIQAYPPEFVKHVLKMGYDEDYYGMYRLYVRLSALLDKKIVCEYENLNYEPFIKHISCAEIRIMNELYPLARYSDAIRITEIAQIYNQVNKEGLISKEHSINRFKMIIKSIMHCGGKRDRKGIETDETLIIPEKEMNLEAILEEENIPKDIALLLVSEWEKIYISRIKYYLKDFVRYKENYKYRKNIKKMIEDVIRPFIKLS